MSLPSRVAILPRTGVKVSVSTGHGSRAGRVCCSSQTPPRRRGQHREGARPQADHIAPDDAARRAGRRARAWPQSSCRRRSSSGRSFHECTTTSASPDARATDRSAVNAPLSVRAVREATRSRSPARRASEKGHVEIRPAGFERSADEHGLQPGEIARPAEDSQAHRSSQPKGRSSSRNSYRRLRDAISARAASTCRAANALRGGHAREQIAQGDDGQRPAAAGRSPARREGRSRTDVRVVRHDSVDQIRWHRRRDHDDGWRR